MKWYSHSVVHAEIFLSETEYSMENNPGQKEDYDIIG